MHNTRHPWPARAFAAMLSFVLIGVYAINRLNPSARGMSALIVQMRHPGSILAGLLCITLISPVLGIFDRSRLAAAMARLLFAVAAALAVGYRLSWLAWLFIALTLMYWSSYLPGEGQAYFFLDFMIVILIALSVLAFRYSSHPLELPDSAWPGYRAAGARSPIGALG